MFAPPSLWHMCLKHEGKSVFVKSIMHERKQARKIAVPDSMTGTLENPKVFFVWKAEDVTVLITTAYEVVLKHDDDIEVFGGIYALLLRLQELCPL